MGHSIMLEMKNECLECHCELSDNSEVHVCSYECTYCDSCVIEEILFVRTAAEIYRSVPNGRKNKLRNVSAYTYPSLLAEFSTFKWGYSL